MKHIALILLFALSVFAQEKPYFGWFNDDDAFTLRENFQNGFSRWTVSSGSYAVVDSTNYSGTSKSLRCATAGIISIPCRQAYGTWEFDLKKGGDANVLTLAFISNIPAVTSYYYWFNLSGTERVQLGKTAIDTYLAYTTAAYVVNWTNYRVKITRNTNGSFSLYIKGGTFGTEYVLVSVAGGTGTNPVTDNTYTSSNYFVLDLDAGDMIANINVYPYIK